jgi:predicted transcriptional regulator
MAKMRSRQLSRRERQIMDIVYAQQRATAQEVREAMEDAPSYSAVRALLRILVEKGHLRHTKEGARYVYHPTQPRRSAAREALSRVLNTFYEGSAVNAVAALLDLSSKDISEEELERLSELVDEAKSEGR